MYERNYTYACSVFIQCNEFHVALMQSPFLPKFPALRTRSIRPGLEVSAVNWSLLMDKIGKEIRV
jgi:hypothetical protein